MSGMPINIIFDGPPDHKAGRFVEVETDDGRSINSGEWSQRPDGLWALRVTSLPPEQNQEYAEVDRTLTPADKNELDMWLDKMGYHKATPVTVPIHRELRQDFMHLAEEVIRKVPAGRERTMALGRLQEALMYANAAVAITLAPIALDD